jgi:quercetin dioxygenase-like cupin family protein
MARSLARVHRRDKFRFWDCQRPVVGAIVRTLDGDVKGGSAMTQAHLIQGKTGESYELGNIRMRLLASTAETNGAFALGEFSGGEGPWTVRHVHSKSEESFYVLEGRFTFTIGDGEVDAGPGSFIRVSRDTRHQMRAAPGGGRFLTLWTPGGLEAMFVELSRLAPDSLRDPGVRQMLSARFDSIPI